MFNKGLNFEKRNNQFLTDFWTEKQIPHPREGKKIPPPRASPSGEEFFNLPLGEEFVSRSKNPSGIGYSHIVRIIDACTGICFLYVVKKFICSTNPSRIKFPFGNLWEFYSRRVVTT